MNPKIDGLALTALTFPTTVVLAMALWRFVEKPTFSMVKPVEAGVTALWQKAVTMPYKHGRQV